MQRLLQRFAIQLVGPRSRYARGYVVAGRSSPGQPSDSASQSRVTARGSGRSRLLESLERERAGRPDRTSRTSPLGEDSELPTSSSEHTLDALSGQAQGQDIVRKVFSRSLLELSTAERTPIPALLGIEDASASVESTEPLDQVRHLWRQRKSRLLETVGEPERLPTRSPRQRRFRGDTGGDSLGRTGMRSSRSYRFPEWRSTPPSVSLLPPSVRQEQARIATTMIEHDGPAALEKVRALDADQQRFLESELNRQRRRKLGKYLIYKNRYMPSGTFRAEQYHTEDLWINHTLQAAESVLAEIRTQRQAQLGEHAAEKPLWIESVVADLFTKARSVQEVVLMIRLLRKAVHQVQQLPAETRQSIFAKDSGPFRDALKQL